MKRFRILFVVPILMLILILAACGNTTTSSGGTTYPTTTPPTPTPTTASKGTAVKTASVPLNGKTVTALTNDTGWTLYYFAPDTATTSACTTTSCTTTWPPLVSNSGAPTSGSTLPGTLGVQANANGSQVTYNGHNLYTYAPDGGPGQTKGEGVAGKWHVATTDLAPLGGGSSTTPTPTTGGSYPSY